MHASRLSLILLGLFAGSLSADDGGLKLLPLEERAPDGFVEIRGVAAGVFNASHWREGPPYSLPDHRAPLLAPRPGKFQNIYAPSIVQTEAGWRVFYGAWDGVETGNDRIYSVDTSDFLQFGTRQTLIEHGAFHHVCNVSALRLDDGSFAMACTALPKEGSLNKPVQFTSPDGEVWNGTRAPHAAGPDDLIEMTGYESFATADVNGMNVLLRDGDAFRLYFSNFKDFGRVYRASSCDGVHYTFDGPVIESATVVNDVKKIIDARGEAHYLMTLHLNGPRLWYSLSGDSMRFPPVQALADHEGDADRYIVSVGWVMDGAQETPGRRVLGFLYGAGAKPSLDANRIFARWFQNKAVIVRNDGREIEPIAARGPDRQLLAVVAGTTGKLRVTSQPGDAPTTSQMYEFRPGDCFEIVR